VQIRKKEITLSSDRDQKSIWARTPKNPLGDSIVVNWRIAEWFKDIPAKTQDKLKTFHNELLKENIAINLIGVKTIPMADAIHFADSILGSRVLMTHKKPKKIFDLSAGNGFPGLILGILYPDVQIVIVEVDARKAGFLTRLSSQMGLVNTQVLTTQIDKLPDHSIECGITRGLGSISKASLLLRKPFTIGGELFHMKGEEWFKEVSDMPTQLCSIWKASLVSEYSLPVGEIKFGLVKTTKFAD
jgi:16S rRNA (guanine527-N7)-methyltransferase